MAGYLNSISCQFTCHLSSILAQANKMHHSKQQCCFSYSVQALDIIDYEKRCRRHLSSYAPNVEWALLSLECLIEECKIRTDLNAIEYNFHPLLNFLKGLPMVLPFETDNITLVTKLKYLYFKRKLCTILKDNLFDEYISLIKKVLKTSTRRSEVENIIRKFFKVCSVVKPQTELISEEIRQYEFIAELLKLCYEANIQDSHLVTTLVQMAIDRNLIELLDSRYVRQPMYPEGFFKYILEHVTKERFCIVSYVNDHPRTLWEFSRNFSVVNAVSFGNMNRLVTLLKYGFEVFPESEIMKSGHKYPNVKEIIPKGHRMVLHIISAMRSINTIIMNSTHIYSNDWITLTNDQKECFRFIWRAVEDPYVKQAEMGLSITAEYFHLARRGVLNPMRYEENTKSSILYEMCFTDMTLELNNLDL
ncbi:SOCS box domain-containing protein [Caerostris extrusa]|uniref:SOCS box domain-containing protein n=1 Tax=Caerostris extrusa TaxID=172846 RepID=A0AAV4YG36_CAEEX|nr:SOCS box domain-containing protein [Caerostris extrusa]